MCNTCKVGRKMSKKEKVTKEVYRLLQRKATERRKDGCNINVTPTNIIFDYIVLP